MPETATPPFRPRLTPHVLVAEDDLISGHFFQDTLHKLGYRACVERSGAHALARARKERFDLLLLDCRMPDFGAVRLLTTLREEPDSASHAAPALAMSAEMDPRHRQQLLAAGFLRVLDKPIPLRDLRQIVLDLLPMAVSTTLLSDDSAREASGNDAIVQALRQLFVQELEVLCVELDTLAEQPQILADRLHRLIASCGFCGAEALISASRAFRQALPRHAGTTPAAAMQDFRQVLEDTLHAVRESL